MIVLCNTLLPNDRVHAIPADIGKKFIPTPIIDRVVEIDVAPRKTTVSTGSSKMCLELYNSFISFWIYGSNL